MTIFILNLNRNIKLFKLTGVSFSDKRELRESDALFLIIIVLTGFKKGGKEMPQKKESKELARPEPSRAVSLLGDMERRFDDFFKRPFSSFGLSWWPRLRLLEAEEVSPSVDIFEEADDVVVKAELPGVKKEDLDLTLTGNTISISGEKKKEEKVEKKNYYRFEQSYGSFCRSLNLPKEVQTDKAKSRFKDGVLEIRIPKTEEAKKKETKLKID